jgi:hypothetical protein
MHSSSGGGCIANKIEAVKGVGGMADFFTHKNVPTWHDKKQSQAKRHKKEEFRKMIKREKETE